MPVEQNPIRRFSGFQLALMIAGGVMLLFVLAPMLGMVIKTSTKELLEVSVDDEVLKSLRLTLFAGMVGTLCLSVFAIPFSYFLARTDFFGKNVVIAVLDLPIVIPHSAVGIALLGIMGRYFVGHPVAIITAMAYVSLPYLINAARDGFAAVPERLEKTAATLGASQSRIFFTIALPMAWRSVVSGMVLMFARGLSEFGAVVIVAYQPMITPVLIWERFSAFGLKHARPIAVLLLCVTLVIFILLRIIGEKRHASR